MPVGGLEKIPTFIALLNQQLNVAAIHDSDGKGITRLQDMVDKKVIDAANVINLLKFAESTKAADLEDLFEEDWYLELLSKSGVAKIEKANLKSKHPRVVKLALMGDSRRTLPLFLLTN